MRDVRVRYAPSPTGLLHIGNARSALFNYLFAKHYKGTFIVRIEDTDIKRNVTDGERSQLELLEWLGIEIDESPVHGGSYGPYRQLERLDLYKKYSEDLIISGLAYKESNGAIRFKVPKDKVYTFHDIVRGELSFLSEDIEDWILMKENGIPTYNFAVVIDDHYMKITHVLRGEEHITNTPKQLMVYEAFKWEKPEFGHMTIIVNEQKKKLSKRDQNVIQFISEYKRLGYLPDAMFNFISLLGWSPPIEEEILSKELLISYFNGERLVKAPSMFDKEKLAFINSKYIKKLTHDALADLVKPYFIEANIDIKSESWLKELVVVFQDRMHYLYQIIPLYNEFLTQPFVLSEESMYFLKDNQSLRLLETFKEKLDTINYDPEAIQALIKDVGILTETKGKPLFMGIRIATTGDSHGPSLPQLLSLLSKEKVVSRLVEVIKLLRGES
jgi:glutamyl-tRNA synthetase/nondiscriminating glutamyl-tRNA synthetase